MCLQNKMGKYINLGLKIKIINVIKKRKKTLKGVTSFTHFTLALKALL